MPPVRMALRTNAMRSSMRVTPFEFIKDILIHPSIFLYLPLMVRKETVWVTPFSNHETV